MAPKKEAGEHFTPREVIKLMTNLVFIPVKDHLPNPLTIYDPACGSGGMLTESQDFITDPEGEISARLDFSRKLKWDPSDFSSEK